MKNAGKKIEWTEFLKLKEELKKNGSFVSSVITGSMEPDIPTGSLVEVVPVNEAIRKFDIVVFWRNGKLVCHYVGHINRLRSTVSRLTFSTWSIKGDREDLPFDEERVFGKVVSHSISKLTKFKINLRRIFQQITER
jgi:hypothetical protein